MAKKDFVARMLSRPVAMVKMNTGPLGLLGRLFWLVVEQTEINGNYINWSTLMRRYVHRKDIVPIQTVNKRSEARSNLEAALTASNPSLLQFIRGLLLIGAYEITFSISIKRVNLLGEHETITATTTSSLNAFEDVVDDAFKEQEPDNEDPNKE